MLRSLPLAAKQHWTQQIQTLTFAYNATVHETTGYAPFYLMFGRVPRLPVDMVFRQVLKDASVVDYKTYASKLMASLHEAAGIAQQHTRKEQQHQADGYNKKVRGTCLNVGDRVLLANKAERGKRKLADKWEPTIYTVMDCNPQTHIYKIEDENGKTRVAHQNLILDVSFLPVPEQTSAESSSATKDGISGSQTQPPDALRGLPEEISENRTLSWVCMSSDVGCESLGNGEESEEGDETSPSAIWESDQLSCAGSLDNSASSGIAGQRGKDLPSRDSPDSNVISRSPTPDDHNDSQPSVHNMSGAGYDDILPETVVEVFCGDIKIERHQSSIQTRMKFNEKVSMVRGGVVDQKLYKPSIPDSLFPRDSIHLQDRTVNSWKSKGEASLHAEQQVCSDVEIISTGCSRTWAPHDQMPALLSSHLDQYASSVLDHISTTIDSVTTQKQITMYPNQKPWMNWDVRLLLKARNTAFRSGDAQAYSTARAELKRGIKKAKHRYKGSLTTSMPVLRGGIPTATKAAVTPDHQPLTLSPDDVGAVLGRIVVHKAAGPDGIPGRVLRACSGELAEALTDIFNLSLAHAVVPTCFKSTSIIPVTKNSKPSSLNDYRPVALTPIITKCFERLVLAHLKSCLPTLDHQFAYRRTGTEIQSPCCTQPSHTWTIKTPRQIAVHRLQFSI
ncbi:hypothetical protein L3Q82_005941 [Scortum barcoo]|uniref:Uncharacterized protein n=2 Tax=Scortum barcoo TaxID=214431 RepID=A0ACB8X292_9TELE|nr:hypothetical protein L3Q82_005941 [Scortum barcoo]